MTKLLMLLARWITPPGWSHTYDKKPEWKWDLYMWAWHNPSPYARHWIQFLWYRHERKSRQ